MSEIKTRESKNNVPTISLTNRDTSKEDAFLDYIASQTEDIQRKSKLGTNGDITLQEVQNALKNYTPMLWQLQNLYVLCKKDQIRINEDFKDFVSRKYLEARAVLNPNSLSAQKWYSTTEIEYYVRTHWADEYNKYNSELQLANLRLETASIRLKGWEDYKWCLTSLVKSLVAEVTNLGTGVKGLDFEED